MKEAIAIAFNKLGTKTFGLFAKDQRITGLDRDIPHRLGCACREKKATLNWDDMIDKFVDVIVDLYIHALPVVESGTTKTFVVDLEAKGFDQM
tara:strand:- start:7201 stop:7479 length:279 start_codon:yes stop_codon:yes gene_type:complete